MSQRTWSAPNWEAYEHGRSSSTGSLESVSEDLPAGISPTATSAVRHIQPSSYQDGTQQDLRRRRSSFTMRLNSIRQMGGPNSIDNFARSVQRSAGFRDITPIRRASISITSDGGEEQAHSQPHLSPNRSLLRQQIEAQGRQGLEEQSDIEEPYPQSETSRLLLPTPTPQSGRFRHISHQPSIPTNLGASYGSISSHITESARRRASILIDQQREANLRALEDPEDKDELQQRQIEREVRPDGEVVERIVGESTVPMTVFNSTNVLIGIGVLALPLGFKYAGWVVGITTLSLAALMTAYSARLLAKCLDTNSASSTYGDIAFLAFDSWGRGAVETLFILELTAANVALIILFGDSVNYLIPAVSVLGWKVIISLALLPLNFVPFKTLSITSVIGIFCCLSIILIIFIDGFIKPNAPGSLREVAQTSAFPSNWKTIPLSFGLFMAPWGGHSVFPAIYRDMRHPQKYNVAVRYTYIFTYGLDASMAIVGYLMFGQTVRDEVTSNILRSKNYPHALAVLTVVLIAIIPITKMPLTNRPMIDTANKKFYIDLRQMDAKARQQSEKSWRHRAGRASIATLANLIQLGIAIGFPDFDSIMALMGSAFCFTVCMILPLSFHLKIFGRDIPMWERILNWVLLSVCAALAVIGTVWAILPKDKLGIE